MRSHVHAVISRDSLAVNPSKLLLDLEAWIISVLFLYCFVVRAAGDPGITEL